MPAFGSSGFSNSSGRWPSPVPARRSAQQPSSQQQPFAAYRQAQDLTATWNGMRPYALTTAPNFNSRDPFGDMIRSLRQQGYEYDPGYLAAQWRFSGYRPPDNLDAYSPQALASQGVRPTAQYAPRSTGPGGSDLSQYLATRNRGGRNDSISAGEEQTLRLEQMGGMRRLQESPTERAQRIAAAEARQRRAAAEPERSYEPTLAERVAGPGRPNDFVVLPGGQGFSRQQLQGVSPMVLNSYGNNPAMLQSYMAARDRALAEQQAAQGMQ